MSGTRIDPNNYSLIPRTARDVARGIMGVPSDVASLLGAVGVESAGEWGRTSSEWLDENIMPRADFTQDPVRAGIQAIAPALIPIPGTGLAGLATRGGAAVAGNVGAAAGRVAGTLGELAVPGTAGYTAGRVAANAGVSAAAGATMDNVNLAAEDAFVIDLTQAGEGSRTPTTVLDLSAPASQPITLDLRETASRTPTSSRNVLDDVLSGNRPENANETVLDLSGVSEVIPGNSMARTVRAWLPYVAVGVGGVVAGGAGARQLLRSRADDLAAAGSIVQSGTQRAVNETPGIYEQFETGMLNDQQLTINRLRDVNKTNYTPQQAADAENAVFLQNRETINNERAREILSTGDVGNGITIPRFTDVAYRASQMDPTTLNAAREAIAAMDELDTRQNNARRGAFRPGTVEPERSAFTALDDAELRRRAAPTFNNPEIQAIRDDFKAIHNGMLDMLVAERAISVSEAVKFRNMHPNYLHTMFDEIEANNKSPLTTRRGDEGSRFETAQDPFASVQEAVRRSVDYALRNEARRTVAYALGNRTDVRGVGNIIPQSQKVRKGYEGVEFTDGGAKLQIEMIPEMAAAWTNAPRAVIAFLNGSRVLAQASATGFGGVLGGNIQALTSAISGATLAAVAAPKHLNIGIADQLVRKATGGQYGFRQLTGLVDPTFALQMVAQGIRDVKAEAVGGFANAAMRALESDGILKKVLGTNRLTNAMNSAREAYLKSDRHEMLRLGATSSGISFGYDLNPSNMNALASMSPEYAKRMSFNNGMTITETLRNPAARREFMDMVAARATPTAARRIVQVMQTLLDLASNVPQSTIYRANKAQYVGREASLAGEVRKTVGDPAQYGGSTAVQKGTSALMYSNIGLQAGHTLMQAFKRDPVRTSIGVASLGTMLSLGELYSAIIADEANIEQGKEPEYVAHLATRDPRDSATGFNVYVPGTDPTTPYRIPVDQMLAPFTASLRASMLHLTGALNPAFFTGRFAPLREHLGEVLNDRERRDIFAGIGAAGGDLTMPPLVDIGARLLTGQDTSRMLNFATGSRVTPVEQQSAPGSEQGQFTNDPLNRHVAAVLQAQFTIAGSAFASLARQYGYVSQVRGPTDTVAAMNADYSLNRTGATRVAAPLLMDAGRLNAGDLIGSEVRETEVALEKLQQNVREARGADGTIGTGNRMRESPYEGGGLVGARDQQIADVWNAAVGAYQQFAPLREQRKMVYDQITALRSSPKERANPLRMREEQNRLSAAVREVNAQIYDNLQQLNQQLSEQYGRRINVRNLNPQRGIDQFPTLR